MKIFNILNRFVKPLLRSPLHVLFSYRFMLVTFTGRKSGKTYTTPVEYHRDGSLVTFFSPRSRTWWKNLTDQPQVTLRIKGRDLHGRVTQVTDDTAQMLPTLKKMFGMFSEERLQKLGDSMMMIQVQL